MKDLTFLCTEEKGDLSYFSQQEKGADCAGAKKVNKL